MMPIRRGADEVYLTVLSRRRGDIYSLNMMFAGYYTGVPGGRFFSWMTDYPRGGAEEDKNM